MWSLIAQPFSQLWSKLLLLVLPWLRRFIFNHLIKRASRGALKKAPLSFHVPNLIVAGIAFCVINGINFFITLWFTDSVAVSLISAGSVTAVTAFFLLRGFFCPHTRRERTVLLMILLVFFGLFCFFRVVIDIPWIALVTKLTMEVIFCFAVMMSEVNRLNKAQGIAINVTLRTLRISPEGFIGRMILKFFAPKNTLPVSEVTAEGEDVIAQNDKENNQQSESSNLIVEQDDSGHQEPGISDI